MTNLKRDGRRFDPWNEVALREDSRLDGALEYERYIAVNLVDVAAARRPAKSTSPLNMALHMPLSMVGVTAVRSTFPMWRMVARVPRRVVCGHERRRKV